MPDYSGDADIYFYDRPAATVSGMGVRAPLVTFIILNRNRAEDLADTVTAVTNQDYARIEVIIVDMGSTDRSLDRIRTLVDGDSRCHALDLEGDVGPMQAALQGLDLAKGAFVTFVTPDEILTPNYASLHIQAHLALPSSVALTTSTAVKVGEDGAALTGDAQGAAKPEGRRHGLRASRSVPRLRTVDAALFATLGQCTSTTPPNLSPRCSPSAANMFRRYVLELARPSVESLVSVDTLPSPYFTFIGHFIGGSADIDLPLLKSKIWAEEYSSDVPDFPRQWMPRRRGNFDLERQLMAATLLARAPEFNRQSNGRLWLGLDQAFGATPKTFRGSYARPAARELLRQHVEKLLQSMSQRTLIANLRLRMSRADLRFLLQDPESKTVPRKIARLLWQVERDRFIQRLKDRFRRHMGARH